MHLLLGFYGGNTNNTNNAANTRCEGKGLAAGGSREASSSPGGPAGESPPLDWPTFSKANTAFLDGGEYRRLDDQTKRRRGEVLVG